MSDNNNLKILSRSLKVLSKMKGKEMKKLISKSMVLIIGIFLSLLLIAPATIYAAGPVTDITVTGAGDATTVANGGNLAMSAAVLPADADDPSVAWSVAAGTGTATIDATTGVLTGTGVGTVTVTATANDGSTVTGTLEITVTASAPTLVTSITVTGAGDATTVANGGNLAMSAAVLPADADDPSVAWSVAAGTGTATIDATTGVLTGTGVGTVTVTATANDGSTVTGTLEITVTASAPTLVTSITVTGAGDATTVANGGNLAMSAAVLPADADDPSVAWSVAAGTGTATIDATTGVLTGTGVGTVTVTATANDGSTVTGTLEITVTASAPISITGIDPINGTPQVSVELTAGGLIPSGATATYQWQKADTSGGTFADISGATLNKYTPVAGDIGKFIRVVATGTSGDTGTAVSDPTTTAVVAAAIIQPTVPLGATSTFAILAYSLISDAGAASIINGAGGGDVGLSPTSGAAITGLTSAHVSGTIYVVSADGPAGYVINPSLLTTAKNNLDAAYSNAAGRTPTETFTGNNSLAGKTLTSGVYAFASGTTDLDGTLTLDAQGDENAVFIFQASSSLITSSASRVELINSARYCRVFWVVPSSATLGSDSTFVGHIFAYASISVTSGTTVYGQLLARTGAVTLDHDTITNGPCETTTSGGEDTTEETSATPTIAGENTTEETTAASTEIAATTTEAPVKQTAAGGQLPKLLHLGTMSSL